MDGHRTPLDLIFEELAAETGGNADLMKKTFLRRIVEEES